MTPQSIADNNEWWGFSPTHGWVVLDRNVVANRSGRTENLIFLRCNDWSHFEEDRKQWDRPYYIFANQYLNTLRGTVLQNAKNELEKLKDQFKHKKIEIYSAVIKQIHSQFLADRDLPYCDATTPTKRGRVSKCWNCKQPVDNSVDLECSSCEWIICGLCGACGCAYGK